MNIDLSTINFKGGGGSFAPPKLQMKMRGIARNGNIEVTPSEGYEGLSEVEVNAALTGETSAIDFSVIGYDTALSNELNDKWNNDIAYSKTLYDAWNPNKTSANYLYYNDTKLVYAPNINTSNVTSIQYMFQGCSNLTSIPPLNTSNVTNMNSTFKGCSKLTSIPLLECGNVTYMAYMFDGCSNLITIPNIDTSKVSDMSSAFQYCSSLTTIPNIVTSNVKYMDNMFGYCSSLTTIPPLNTNNVMDMQYLFSGCAKLESLPLLDCSNVTKIDYFFGFSNITTLTQVGGFKDLKVKFDGLQSLPNLSYESILNVLNNLYDFRGNGDTTTTRTIKFHSNALALMTDEDKAIATSKGWVIS